MSAGRRIYVSAVSPIPGVQSVASRPSECAALTRASRSTGVGLDELLRRALHDPLSTAA
jgi:hypothetical protein